MFDVLFIACFVRRNKVRRSRNVAPEEGQEPNLPEIELLCHESFDEGKFILPLVHKLPILSTTT
jgi:hypothetical protein